MYYPMYKLTAYLCILACVSGCGSSVKLTREGKSLHSPVRAILVREFGVRSGLDVPPSVVKDVANACTESIGKDSSIHGIAVTTDEGQCPSDSAVEVRGEFKTYTRAGTTIRTIGGPQRTSGPPVTTIFLKVQVQIHDRKTGLLLASKTVGGEYLGARPSIVGTGLVMIPYSEEAMRRGLSRDVADQAKDVVRTYLRTAWRG